MNASNLHERGPAADRLKESLTQYTWHDVVVFCDQMLLRTSYWLKSGSVLRDAFLEGQIDPTVTEVVRSSFEGVELDQIRNQPFSVNEASWQAAAHQLGLPEAVPKAVDSIRKVEAQRAAVLPRLIYDDKLSANMSEVVKSHGLSEPGDYRPALLSGPTGASKTHAVLATYAILGMAVNLIEGSASESGDVRIEKITGGSISKDSDFSAFMSDVAAKGHFQTSNARLHYYQELSLVAKNAGCDLVDAHGRIPKESWLNLARLDSYPVDEQAFTVPFPGQVRMGQIADQINLVDEVNKFSSANQGALRDHLSSATRTAAPNTAFVFTANPPSQDYPRTPMSADLLGCCRVHRVSPRSKDEYRSYIAGWFCLKGADSATERQARKLVTDNNPRSPDRSAPTEMGSLESTGREPSLVAALPPKLRAELADRLAPTQVFLETEALQGGLLHPETYGSEDIGSRPSVRSLATLLKCIDSKLLLESLRTQDPVSDLPPATVGNAITESITEEIYARYTYSSDGPTVMIDPDAVPSAATDNSVISIDAALLKNKLDPDSVAALVKDLGRDTSVEKKQVISAIAAFLKVQPEEVKTPETATIIRRAATALGSLKTQSHEADEVGIAFIPGSTSQPRPSAFGVTVRPYVENDLAGLPVLGLDADGRITANNNDNNLSALPPAAARPALDAIGENLKQTGLLRFLQEGGPCLVGGFRSADGAESADWKVTPVEAFAKAEKKSLAGGRALYNFGRTLGGARLQPKAIVLISNESTDALEQCAVEVATAIGVALPQLPASRPAPQRAAEISAKEAVLPPSNAASEPQSTRKTARKAPGPSIPARFGSGPPSVPASPAHGQQSFL